MTFKAQHARWQAEHGHTDTARAALILGELDRLLLAEGRSRCPSLRLIALAQGAPGPDAALLASIPAPPADRPADVPDWVLRRLSAAHRLGQLLDLLNAAESVGVGSGQAGARRSLGSYFTPPRVAASLVDRAVRCGAASSLLFGKADVCRPRVCDPAMGGGAFLLEATRALAQHRAESGESWAGALAGVSELIHGLDVNGLAVATAEAALWLLTNQSSAADARLLRADALRRDELPRAFGAFDWVVGNPPWVAFQGRAGQRLAPAERQRLRREFSGFRGYPTLHGVFTERAAELGPQGLISLLLPSSLSDLDGYRSARAALMRTHRPEEPLCEYGEDAFESVVQPCFGLVAVPHGGVAEAEPTRPWRLLERSHGRAEAVAMVVPTMMERLAAGPRLPPSCFGEMGLQTNSRVVRELLRRAPAPSGGFVMPLLEGRDVGAFSARQPQLFMNPDPVVLAETRCRLRAADDYQRVAFIVRQTAAFTIAAKHRGERFRNSLLAGFASLEYDADLLVGLLNSLLLRAFHVAGQRDARQVTFPQVKVAHLRRLPAPPENAPARNAVRVISRELHESSGLPKRAALDEAVFALYGVSTTDRAQVLAYLHERAPRALSV